MSLKDERMYDIINNQVSKAGSIMSYLKPNTVILMQSGEYQGKMLYVCNVCSAKISGWLMTRYRSDIEKGKDKYHLKTEDTDSWVFFAQKRSFKHDLKYTVVSCIPKEVHTPLQTAFRMFAITRQHVKHTSYHSNITPKSISSIVSGGKVSPK